MISVSSLNDPSAGISALSGNIRLSVTHACSAEEASEGALVFVKSGAQHALDHMAAADFGAAVVCDAKAQPGLASNQRLALLTCENPRLTFMRLVTRHFPAARPPPGIHPTACVDASAAIDRGASIGAFCYIGKNCRIGSGTVLHPNVTLYENVEVGRNVTINSGTVIGADGFGYERTERGLEKFPHLGGVVIEDDVEIGSNTSIDRGSLGKTRLRRGAKIDNQIHIAHNADVGEDAAIIAQSMVGGSVTIGREAWLAPAAVVMNQVRIGVGALVGLGAVVTKSVPDGETVMGSPASSEAEFKAVRSAIKALARGQ